MNLRNKVLLLSYNFQEMQDLPNVDKMTITDNFNLPKLGK